LPPAIVAAGRAIIPVSATIENVFFIFPSYSFFITVKPAKDPIHKEDNHDCKPKHKNNPFFYTLLFEGLTLQQANKAVDHCG
jgi:hypothetical protein